MIQRFSTFVGTISQINRCIQTIKCREMSAFGLRGTHVMCLFHLQQHPDGLTAAQLTALCREDKAAISRSLSEMERHGLVAYAEPKTAKRYRAPLTLSETGKEVCQKMDEIILHMVERGARGYSPEEREIFYKVLLQIADNLQEACQ